MITKLTDQEVIANGARNRAGYLLEQASLTLGEAAKEGKPLTDLLPDGYLAEVQAIVTALEAARQDRALMAAEAKESTNAHHGATAQAKVWKRKVARRACRARRLGEAVPEDLAANPQAKNGPALIAQVSSKLGMLQAAKDSLPGAGVDALIQEGTALLDTLKTADAQKDLKRLSDLPATVQAFYRQKGLLYIALKVINDAAQELYAGDPQAAARFSLGVLHRRRRAAAGQPAPARGSTPAPAAEAKPELVEV